MGFGMIRFFLFLFLLFSLHVSSAVTGFKHEMRDFVVRESSISSTFYNLKYNINSDEYKNLKDGSVLNSNSQDSLKAPSKKDI